jgi:hypothetical protein
MRKAKGKKEGWKSNFEPYRGMGKNDQNDMSFKKTRPKSFPVEPCRLNRGTVLAKMIRYA